MKKLHTFLPMMVVACLLMLLPTLKAEAAEGKPGQEITVTFSFNEIRGLDGVFTFSNEGILENISYSSTFSGVRFNGNKVFYSTTNQGATQGSITVTATIKANAAVGSSCTVTLGDINITDTDTNSVYSGSKSEVVNVVAEPVVTKAPVNPTPTPASSSVTPAPTASTGSNVQNPVVEPDNNDNQGQSNNSSQSIEVTKAPQSNNNSDNKNSESNSIEATRTATTSPSEPATSEIVTSEVPGDTIEVDAVANNNKSDKGSGGSSIWLILLIISIIANLILAGILIWRKILKNADTGKDTPLVDYDINEDDEPLEIEESE